MILDRTKPLPDDFVRNHTCFYQQERVGEWFAIFSEENRSPYSRSVDRKEVMRYLRKDVVPSTYPTKFNTVVCVSFVALRVLVLYYVSTIRKMTLCHGQLQFFQIVAEVHVMPIIKEANEWYIRNGSEWCTLRGVRVISLNNDICSAILWGVIAQKRATNANTSFAMSFVLGSSVDGGLANFVIRPPTYVRYPGLGHISRRSGTIVDMPHLILLRRTRMTHRAWYVVCNYHGDEKEFNWFWSTCVMFPFEATTDSGLTQKSRNHGSMCALAAQQNQNSLFHNMTFVKFPSFSVRESHNHCQFVVFTTFLSNFALISQT